MDDGTHNMGELRTRGTKRSNKDESEKRTLCDWAVLPNLLNGMLDINDDFMDGFIPIE